jgi:hypothetical protein
MSELEKRCTSLWFKIDPATVQGPLVGLIIGECPGPNTRSTLPMFPYPKNSAGGRLLKMSRLPVGVYLGKIKRQNLIEHHCPSSEWPKFEAATRARAIAELLTNSQTRVLLLGKKVGEAFGFSRFFILQEILGSAYTCIPHPSGLSREYNDPVKRTGAQIAVQWCADHQVNL